MIPAYERLRRARLGLYRTPRPRQSQAQNSIALAFLGVLLLIGGLCVTAYFLFVYDTTVGDTYNVGLQQNRQLGFIGGVVTVVVGIAMLIVDGMSHGRRIGPSR